MLLATIKMRMVKLPLCIFEDLLTCLEKRLDESLPVLSNFANGDFNDTPEGTTL